MGDAEMIAALRHVLPRCEPVRYSGTCWGVDLPGGRWIASTPDGVTIERPGPHAVAVEYTGDAAGARAYLQAQALATLALLQDAPQYVSDYRADLYPTPEAAVAASEEWVLDGDARVGDRAWWGVVVGTAVAEWTDAGVVYRWRS